MAWERLAVAALSAATCALVPRVAHAQASTIKQPGAHPRYAVELEPHASLGAFDAPGAWTGSGPGLGFRASIPIVHQGFVPSINNSVALSFGADLVWYGWRGAGDAGYRGACRVTQPGPNGTTICVDVDGERNGGSATMLFAPVVLQWSFWLTSRWSVFGEPGLMLYGHPWGAATAEGVRASPVFYVGGRYLFGRAASLTMRVGYPTISIGISLFP